MVPDFYRGGRSPDLLLENENLKAELAKLQSIKSQLPERPREFLRTVVYSRYPFNFKSEMLVGVNRDESVAVGKAVVFGGVLVGEVQEVFGDTALVITVFDSRFKSAVRIGRGGADALFKGGSLPKIVLIPLGAKVAEGDIVYSASPDFPYGLPLGRVRDIKASSDNLFKEATLDLAYDINALQTVLISKR